MKGASIIAMLLAALMTGSASAADSIVIGGKIFTES